VLIVLLNVVTDISNAWWGQSHGWPFYYVNEKDAIGSRHRLWIDEGISRKRSPEPTHRLPALPLAVKSGPSISIVTCNRLPVDNLRSRRL
jgi:hypothetical protein